MVAGMRTDGRGIRSGIRGCILGSLALAVFGTAFGQESRSVQGAGGTERTVPSPAAGSQSYRLTDTRGGGEVLRVKIALRARGELQGDPASQQKNVPMSVSAESVYDERCVERADLKESRPASAARWYHLAKAKVQVGSVTETTELPANKRVIFARPDGHGGIHLVVPGGHLTRAELDAIRIPCHSLTATAFLPADAVRVGASWSPDSQGIAAALHIDEVNENGLQARLAEVDRGLARIELTGTLLGHVDGAITQIELTGEIRFDVAAGQLRWGQVKLREERSASVAAPSFTILAEIRMLLEPQPATSDAVTKLPTRLPIATPDESLLEFVSTEAHYRFLHDRKWYILRDDQKETAMQLPDRRSVLAQCNITRLPDLPAGKQLGLEEFQSDIQKALGERFIEFQAARQDVRPDGLRYLRVVARGKVEEAPVHWIYAHLQDKGGHRASFVYTMTEDRVDHFGQQDVTLINSFEFAPDAPRVTSAPSQQTPAPSVTR